MIQKSEPYQTAQQAAALADDHRFTRSITFRLKSLLLSQQRKIKNVRDGIQRFDQNHRFLLAPVLSTSESELWNRDDNHMNRWLTAGKVENLRKAVAHLHGIEIPANAVFSFWKHIGKPSRSKGFVVGREIREGCIIPTIAGGICQLSNALYDAALKAGFEIHERHRHSKIIKGSLAEQGRDATVKWNYIDLRFSSKQDFRIEAELTSNQLRITFKGLEKNEVTDVATTPMVSSTLNDCFSCGNVSCHQHPGKLPLPMTRVKTTCLLDERWPEYEDYLQTILKDGDMVITPSTWIKTPARYIWQTGEGVVNKHVIATTIGRAIKLRRANSRGENIFEQSIASDHHVAEAMAAMIPIDCTHLIISQNLLPGLWKSGQLGGRTWDVLMNRLPIQHLQHQLDFAFALHPQSKTLKDFRASSQLVYIENTALNRASKIITPHTAIAQIFNHKSILLPWKMPSVSPRLSKGKKILFPSSALARKGAIEMKKLAVELQLEIIYTGLTEEYPRFWDGVTATYHSKPSLDEIVCVVYPAYVEHQPRVLLRALSAGIPVVTSRSCGIPPMQQLFLFEKGDYSAMKNLVSQILRANEL